MIPQHIKRRVPVELKVLSVVAWRRVRSVNGLFELQNRRILDDSARQFDFPLSVDLPDILRQKVAVAQLHKDLPQWSTGIGIFVLQQSGAGQSRIGLDLINFMPARMHHVFIQAVLQSGKFSFVSHFRRIFVSNMVPQI